MFGLRRLLAILLFPLAIHAQGNPKTLLHTRASDGLPSDSATVLLTDKGGHVWAAFNKRGVCSYDRKSWVCFDSAHGLSGNDVQTGYGTSFVDSLGCVWIRYASGGWADYDGTSWLEHPLPAEALKDKFEYLFSEKNGRVWFRYATITSIYYPPKYQGIGYFQKGAWHDASTGWAGTEIISSALDEKNNRVWVVYNGAGMGYYDGSKWSNFSVKNGLLKDSVEQDLLINAKGQVFIKYTDSWSYARDHGSVEGCSMFDGVKWRHLFTGSQWFFAWALDANGDLWASGEKFIGRFKDTTAVVYLKYPGTAGIQSPGSICPAPNGNVWITSTFNTPTRFWDGVDSVDYTNPSDFFWDGTRLRLRNTTVRYMTYDSRGMAWGRSADPNPPYTNYKLSRFDGTAWITSGTVIQYGHDREGNTFALFGSASNGEGTSGISVFDGNNWSTQTAQSGLLTDNVRYLSMDGFGRPWIRYDQGSSKDTAGIWGTGILYHGQWANFGHHPAPAPTHEAFLQAQSNGEIWGSFADAKGLVQLTTDSLLEIPVTPNVPRPVAVAKPLTHRADRKSIRRGSFWDMRWILGRLD